MMKLLDILLSLLIPTLILLHLFVAPYTKVEESFNIQATHDILVYNTPTNNIYTRLSTTYDHFTFPGAVPRSFVGATSLAGLSRPIFSFVSFKYGQVVVRALLGLFNAAALLKYRNGVERAFGKDVGRWYVLLQAAQFHVIYYASRTLPNMFAFGLTTLAFREFLPLPSSVEKAIMDKHHRLGIYLFVLAGVIFRSEVALLLFTQLAYLLLSSRCSLPQIIRAGFQSAVIALALTIPIDSYFWQRPIWPELAGFYYNAIQGKSAEWGTSPYWYYFVHSIPRLLLNPLSTLILIPFATTLTSFRYHSGKQVAANLIVPSMLFITIYSLQPHKEARFIIYVVPPLTACAAISASHIWTRRSKNILYSLASLILIASVFLSFAASTIMLSISSLNYPGGEALSKLHKVIERNPPRSPYVYVHMDVLSCMTGVTRFQQHRPDLIIYDKTEDEQTLLLPEFWDQFDYVLAESPEKVIGKWEIVDTVQAYNGIEFLKPSSSGSESERFDPLCVANNPTKMEDGEEKVLGKEDVRESVGDCGFEFNLKKMRSAGREMDRAEMLKLIKDSVRRLTGGWWVGPRMKPAIYVLRRERDGLVGQQSVEFIR